MTERSSKDREFSPEAVAAEMAEHVDALGTKGRNVKEAIALAARRAGLTWGQAKRLRYREWAVIPAHVADRVREARAELDRKIENAAFREARDIDARISRLEAAVLHDPEFTGPHLDALRQVGRIPGRSVAETDD